MSLQGALRSGTSGVGVNSQRMAMISDNIANLNTVGYKRIDGRFSTFVTTSSNQAIYASGGVNIRTEREVGQQGTIQPTSQTTDLAISGNGYFVVAQDVQRDPDGTFRASGNVVFTRSGQFRVDRNGNLRNADGFYLLSWPRNDQNTDFVRTNEFTEMEVLNVSNQAFDPIETNFLSLGANLRSNAPDDETFTTSVQINTRQGEPRRLDVEFHKVPGTPNVWDTYTTIEGGAQLDAGGNLLVDQQFLGRLTFNSDGELDDFVLDPGGLTPPPSLIPTPVAISTRVDTDDMVVVAGNEGPDDKIRIALDYDNDGATMDDQVEVTIDLGTLAAHGGSGTNGLTQYYDNQNTMRFIDHNGKQYSALQTVSFDESGVVEGFYDNGESRELFQVPLVTFTNPNGLRTISGNVFATTAQSGLPLTRIAGTGGTGVVSGSSLEGAAVDVAEEFSNMIITQRAYSASTKIITTADEMLEELTRTIR